MLFTYTALSTQMFMVCFSFSYDTINYSHFIAERFLEIQLVQLHHLTVEKTEILGVNDCLEPLPS